MFAAGHKTFRFEHALSQAQQRILYVAPDNSAPHTLLPVVLNFEIKI